MTAQTSLADAERIDIPARQLTGTREEKLEQLDTFLAQLYAVRLVLSGAVPEAESPSPGP